MVVDDDGVVRTVARALLEREGYVVTEAADGSEALALVSKGAKWDLMILDLDMPEVNGRQVLERVRSSVGTAATPVIVLTGSTDPSTEIELMEQGADDYIRKPIDPPRFAARVKAALRRASV
ncbi:MAG: response regulator transcription factor [Gemmatimonadota bacterium]|nr:response regulator transcription factor [Gemmatimonadota bacterium]